ncbi:MAG: CHAT domain-containing protein, partial [bacterium]
MPAGLYLSHALHEPDTEQANRLRRFFTDRDVPCQTDEHRMGDRELLPDEVIDALDSAVGLVVLATPEGCDSPQVQAEVAHALERRPDRIAVIAWRLTRDALAARWPALAKLGCHVLPDDPTDDDRRRAVARAVTMLRPPGQMAHDAVIDFGDIQIEGERVTAWVRMHDHAGEFRAPLGPDEAEKLRWYLEDYHRWPAAEFERRARDIEAELPMWGQALWFALVQALGEAIEPWLRDTVGGRRTITLRVASPRPVPLTARAEAKLIAPLGDLTRSAVLAAVAATRALQVDHRPPEQIERDGAENAAQARLLALPWELLARDGEPLMQRDIAIRRVMVPREEGERIGPRKAPIRVLVVVARPDKAGLIDPRASADALIDAVAPLGGAVALTFLRPPTVKALSDMLASQPFDVLHFDGHGVYEPQSGLGFLCFEHRDPEKRRQGEPELIHGAELRQALGDKPLPLAFLEACQTGQSTETADAAVAAAMLAAGAASVIAMSHSVLVTTAGLFTAAFYRALTEGRTIAQAVTRARQAVAADRRRGTAIDLADDPAARARGETVRKKTFELTDWHVPQLYQRGDDPTLLPGGTALLGDTDAVYALEDRYATLPPVLGHGFVGRLTERLALERALEDHPIALIVGVGGQGKTTLAAELGR